MSITREEVADLLVRIDRVRDVFEIATSQARTYELQCDVDGKGEYAYKTMGWSLLGTFKFIRTSSPIALKKLTDRLVELCDEDLSCLDCRRTPPDIEVFEPGQHYCLACAQKELRCE